MNIDGVLADFEGEFCDRFGFENRHLVNLEERYPDIDKEIIREFVNSPSTYEDLVPLFGGIRLLRDAKEKGFYVLLITSRPKQVTEVTREWLEDYYIEYNELWYAQNKPIAIHEFNHMYINRKIFLLVDDIPSNFDGLPNYVTGLAWSQLWNENYYPRARYNEKSQRVEVKPDTVSGWVKF